MIPNYTSALMTVETKVKEDHAKVCVKMHSSHFRTHSLPHTSHILSTTLPSVLESKCFNEKKQPFHEEVKATAVGHLLEHIILAYMCESKLADGHTEACFNGFTEWDWSKSMRGTYDVIINMSKEDISHLKYAMTKSILLTEKILCSN